MLKKKSCNISVIAHARKLIFGV